MNLDFITFCGTSRNWPILQWLRPKLLLAVDSIMGKLLSLPQRPSPIAHTLFPPLATQAIQMVYTAMTEIYPITQENILRDWNVSPQNKDHL